MALRRIILLADKSQAEINTIAASLETGLADVVEFLPEGSKDAADNLLLDFFNQDALRFLMIFTGAGSINHPDYKKAYRKLDRGSWNTNATQVSYCIGYNYI